MADRAQPGASTVPTRRALVVDDSRAARVAAARLVEPWGFDVDLAEDGAAALRRLEEQAAYDLVLLDLRMPGLDGMSVLSTIKSRWPDGEVIVITGYPSMDTAKEAIRLGAWGYLAKPLTPGEVVEAANSALNQKRWTLRRDGDLAGQANDFDGGTTVPPRDVG